MAQVTEVVKLQRKVLAEVSRLALQDKLADHVEDILTTVVTEDGPRYRCCIHKERAVLKDRINVALSQPIGTDITEAAANALNGEVADGSIVRVLPEACDRCPIDKFMVTDACRNCLAHHCIASCPKKAIMVAGNRAYIDKMTCVECGMCKKSCPYGAIIEISRPCERACDLKAITAAADRRAAIDYDKCAQCGACKIACPFGAISDRTYIVQIIQAIKAKKRVYAIVAPAVVSQFGVKVKLGQVKTALIQFGFHALHEVAFGADIVTLEETKEFAATVPTDRTYMTTSCCPAYVKMVEKHLPQCHEHVSSTVSPMIATARMIRAEDIDAVVVFIGPCIAKKVEGQKNPDCIDYVLTFEELAAMFVGAGINVTEITDTSYETDASRHGHSFASAGGVIKSVIDTAGVLAPDVTIKPHRAEGLGNCKQALQQIAKGDLDANFFEGMACVGGCVGGPGTLNDVRITTKMLETHVNATKTVMAAENRKAVEIIEKGGHWHKE
ncbi:MAG: hydrogenase large subunit domain protein [Anaerosporomusa subterranea]|jgi:[FeFe] hydrogenase (group B1/B3)|nr:hydrogenase large subunit domain protein [Anaerosporomusa subterranea]